MTFVGKVALVVGGASGVGRAMALRMANLGVKVAIVDTDERGLDSTAQQSINITPYHCDISNLQQAQQVVATVERALGPIDRLVHCADWMPTQSLNQMDAETINQLMTINYGGTVNMVKVLLPLMEARQSGDIIVFGAMAGDVPALHLGAYCATKSAIHTFMEVLVRENKHSSVRFVLVCSPPYTVGVGCSRQVAAANAREIVCPESLIDSVEKALDAKRWVVRPSEVALMAWLRRMLPNLLWWVMERTHKKQH